MEPLSCWHELNGTSKFIYMWLAIVSRRSHGSKSLGLVHRVNMSLYKLMTKKNL